MHRLYRLQQRLAITTPEASALLFLAGVLLTGFVARHFQAQATPYDAEHYAELHADFAARTAAASPVAALSNATPPIVALSDSSERGSVPVAVPASRRSGKQAPVRMNLNTASPHLLQRLPRVGPKMAERIIAYREAHGPFERPSHIVRVKGIGPKTFAKMEPYLFVDGERD